ncbi:trypsin-like serine protease [Amycolatopsis sp. cg9]|uniref:trypsin-like serine protease n=1 Tax=Amycolatopsis sp. cg9 TaxID=3238801 RepID=UPI0035234223
MSTPTAADATEIGTASAAHTISRLDAQIGDLTAQRDAAVATATDAATHVLTTLPMAPLIAPATVAAPWMVATRWDCPARGRFDQAESVGVLIGPRHVLTVAHFFDTTLPVPPAIQQNPDFTPFADRDRFIQVGAFTPGGGERYEIVDVITRSFDSTPTSIRPAEARNDIAIAVLDRPVPHAPIRRATTSAVVGDRVSLLGITPQISNARRLIQVDTCVIDRAAGGIQLGADEFCAANLPGPLQVGAGFSGGALVRPGEQGEDSELLGICSRGIGISPEVSPPVVIVDAVRAHGDVFGEALQA